MYCIASVPPHNMFLLPSSVQNTRLILGHCRLEYLHRVEMGFRVDELLDLFDLQVPDCGVRV